MKYPEKQFYLRSPEEMKARFAEVPEAIQTRWKSPKMATSKSNSGKLHYPVFYPPENHTREGYLRKLLAEGLQSRYGHYARAEGEEVRGGRAR